MDRKAEIIVALEKMQKKEIADKQPFKAIQRLFVN